LRNASFPASCQSLTVAFGLKHHFTNISESKMKYLIGYGATLSIWWSIFWRFVLFNAVAGVTIGFIFGFIQSSVGRHEALSFVNIGLGALVAIPIGIWAVKVALSKKHRGCWVRLVAEE